VLRQRRAGLGGELLASCGFVGSLSKKFHGYSGTMAIVVRLWLAVLAPSRHYARLTHLGNGPNGASFNARKPVRLVLAQTSDNGQQFLVCDLSIGRRPREASMISRPNSRWDGLLGLSARRVRTAKPRSSIKGVPAMPTGCGTRYRASFAAARIK
jgi:hypothetical protein